MIHTKDYELLDEEAQRTVADDKRIQALNELRILDTDPESSFDDIVNLAAHICGTPISIVNLIARDRTWFKAKVGMTAKGSPIEISFCTHALNCEGVMTVPDATADARFAGNPAVVLDPKVRFYAGARLLTPSGQPIGTLCVVDYVTRDLSPAQYEALEALARQAMALLELRRRNFELADLAESHSRALCRIEEQMLTEVRFKSVIKTANDGIFLADDAFGVILWNDACRRMFHYSDNEVNLKHFEMLIGEKYHEALRTHIEGLSEETDGADALVELSGVRSNGEEFPIELSISRWKNGDTVFYTGVVRDITDRKRIEEQKNEFVSTVSHELRTPLTSIRGALDMINGGMTGPLSPDTKRLAGIALQSTERLVRLINDILDYEKIASGKAEFHMRSINLSEVTGAAVAEALSFGEQFGVSLVLKDENPGTTLIADSDRLIQVLTNLISNAVKASKQDDSVTIKLSATENTAHVEVIDLGSGIPLEFQSKIFNRFSQADSGGKRKSGSGLGLSIARSIVEKHGGSMGFESAPGKGSNFYFDLPLTFESTIN